MPLAPRGQQSCILSLEERKSEGTGGRIAVKTRDQKDKCIQFDFSRDTTHTVHSECLVELGDCHSGVFHAL
jgi:hypothetical protein